MPFRTIDLCAGIGGIRKGFEMTGDYVNVLSAEVDKYACLTYEHLYGENPNNDLTSEKFKNTVENTQYDVMLAGFPCQTFSRAGNEEGFNDEEGNIKYTGGYFHAQDSRDYLALIDVIDMSIPQQTEHLDRPS